MQNKPILHKRNNGIFYTPSLLAEYLVNPLINKSGLKIFDPAYGGGSLLLAAEKVCKFNSFDFDLFGCDILPSNGLLRHLDQSRLIQKDFFDFNERLLFDIVLMNPPFVRHHLIHPDKKLNIQKVVSPIHKVSLKSDLWVYFLLKSLKHLQKNGSIGAILPWSFLQADYSKDIRCKLIESFRKIRVLGLAKSYFDCTVERIALLWLQDYQSPNSSIEVSYSKDINMSANYKKISKQSWESLFVVDGNIEAIIEECVNKYNFERFENYANIKIGIVTGADGYFILPEIKVKELELLENKLIPILKTSKEFKGLFFNDYQPPQRLILLKNNKKNKKYIESGEKEGYDLRRHSLNRKPWYNVKIGKVPDAFFPYRLSNIPFLAINDSGIQSTNSIHRIYFKDNITRNQIAWIQLSMLSIPGQLSLELYAKIYGSGVLKIEPRILKNVIIRSSKSKVNQKIFNKISSLLETNKKDEAVELATSYLQRKFKLSDEIMKKARRHYLKLKDLRLHRRKS